MDKEFSIMNMPYEMFLAIQLVHLTCRKDSVQSPAKERWDLFRRTNDDSSRNYPKWRIVWWDFKWPQTHSSYVTLLIYIIDTDSSSYEEVSKKKGKESTSSRRMMSRMWYLQVPTCNKWKHHGIQGKIHSMRLLTERRNILWRDICSH